MTEQKNTTMKALGQFIKDLSFENIDSGISEIAKIAADVNQTVENIGARRLYTVIERVFEELSYTAPDRNEEKIKVDKKYVQQNLGELAKASDTSRYVL